MRQYALSIAGWSEKTCTLTCAAGYYWAVTDEQAKAEAIRLAKEAYQRPEYTVSMGNAFPTGVALDANNHLVLLNMKTAQDVRPAAPSPSTRGAKP